MIDALGVYLPDMQADPARFTDLKALRGGEGFRGKLGNLTIVQGGGGVYLKGSLPRFLTGTNALTGTRRGFLEALAAVEKETGLDLRSGRVYQVEIAATLAMQEPPRRYLETWGPLPRAHKDTFRNGQSVQYVTGSRTFKAYDKGAESAPAGLPCPLAERNALRLELAYKRGLKRVLGRFLSPWELAEPDHYAKLVLQWKQAYFRIPKGREAFMQLDGLTAKKAERSLAALGLQTLGLDRWDASIRDAREAGKVDKSTAQRLRELARELVRDTRICEPDALTAELDTKVRTVARFAR